MSLRHSPLHTEHVNLGAKLVAFGGWEMPLAYPTGTLAEHLACRHEAVVFDVSHLGTVRIDGARAFDQLQRTLSNDLTKIGPGGAQYSHLLDDMDGSVLDDVIVWWVAPESFDVMPNAANSTSVREAIGGRNVTDERAVLAIQGPTARRLLGAVSPEAAATPRFRTVPFAYAGHQCIAAGTGYTGEDGVECAVPREVAPRFWRALVAAGILPAGLGARDTLRLEAGLPLHGHELGPGVTPLQVGLAWVVGWNKPEFRGRQALFAERAQGPRRRLRGLLGTGRRPLRAGGVCRLAGEDVGVVTSGSFSPILERGIALAMLPTRTAEGMTVEVGVRGADVLATVVRPPFHRLTAAHPVADI